MFAPLSNGGKNRGGAAVSSVQIIAKDDQPSRRGRVEQRCQAIEVRARAALGHRNAMVTKGRRFAKMRISDDQRVFGTPMDGALAEQIKLVIAPGD
jgi:hypothetical protein